LPHREHNISYCPVYKAGTTTWLYNLCLLMNVSMETLSNGKQQLSTIARRAIPELEYPEAERVLNASRRLLVVRHPFERLLSAYRDKLENCVAGREHGTLHFYRKYGAKIVRKYRSKSRESKRGKKYRSLYVFFAHIRIKFNDLYLTSSLVHPKSTFCAKTGESK